MANKTITREDLLKTPDKAPDGMLRKSVIADSVDAGEGRTIVFTISTVSVDRDNDTVDPNGWDLANYRRNPVVLWAHDYSELPVGKATEIAVTSDGKLKATCEFATHAFAETVFQMVKGGFLRATSVGFAPKRYEVNEKRGGLDFKEQELLEYSIVPVPANPEALVEARAAGVDTEPIVKWAEAVMKNAKTKQSLEPTPEAEKPAETTPVAAAADPAPVAADPAPAGDPAPAADPVPATEPEKAIEPAVLVKAKSLLEEVIKLMSKQQGPDDAPHSVTESATMCGYMDAGDGMTCSKNATGTCVTCGAGMCPDHTMGGKCMTCVSGKAAAPTAKAEEVLLEMDEDVFLDLIAEEPEKSGEATLDISAEDLREVIQAAIAERVGQVVREQTAAALNHARGRVD